ncbi:MAG: hypothetical protein ACI8UO_001335 [Verrucomicrobiales bacterium]
MDVNSWNGNEYNLLFSNLDNGKFSDIARPMGCDEVEESRAVSVADLNNDGSPDLVINNNAAPPTIYLNRMGGTGNFFRAKLTGDPAKSDSGHASSLDAFGARVEVDIEKDGETRTLVRLVEAGAGYAAQSEKAVHFGLGEADTIMEIRIAWPSGTEQSISGEAATQLGLVNRECSIVEGEIPVPVPVPVPGPISEEPTPAPSVPAVPEEETAGLGQ